MRRKLEFKVLPSDEYGGGVYGEQKSDTLR
jgi:hypothetical protein